MGSKISLAALLAVVSSHVDVSARSSSVISNKVSLFG